MNEALKLDNQLCFRLYSASRLLTQAYHPLLSEYGLTYPQYLVLMVLWEKDPQLVGDIAGRLMLETNTVTPLLKRMESAGLVQRRRGGSADGRQVLVSLTPKGRNLEGALSCIPMKIGGRLVCKALTPETVPELYEMLDGIIAKLREGAE